MTYDTLSFNFQNFINDQLINVKNTITLISTKNGYKVNNFTIRKKDDTWLVVNPNGQVISQFMNPRLAILNAALVIRKKYSDALFVANLDRHLDILKHDQKLFQSKIDNKFKTALFEDRLAKTQDQLIKLYEQISKLEKSVGLQ